MDSRTFPLSLDSRREVLSLVFDYDSRSQGRELSLHHGYFTYYQNLVESSRVSCITRSHRDICKVVLLLKQPNATRKSLRLALAKRLSDDDLEEMDEILEDAITLAVRLLLMISTGDLASTRHGIAVSGETTLSWKEDSIKELVSQELVTQTTLKENVRLDKIFNARNLERIGGIKIRWTSNLADHLRMRDNDKAVEIFHYSSFLRLHQSCIIPLPDWQIQTLQTQTGPLLLSAFIDETLRTLTLLLPEFDSDVKKWFEKQQVSLQKRHKLPLDPLARENGQLKVEQRQIEKFEYWHDRLVVLKQVFDEAEPKNIKQWWHDRRKMVQWYTFWVAAIVLTLTIFFGLVQSVEGALQVYASFKSPSH